MSEAKDTPIIMSAPMVQALLDGRKTMSRRLAWQSEADTKRMSFLCDGERGDRTKLASVSAVMAGAYYLRSTPWRRVKPGDRLWVRESLQAFNSDVHATAQYVADITPVPHRGLVEGKPDGRAFWIWGRRSLPSIHMPRWASRLTLVVTAVKIERLQEITEKDARAEGCAGRLGPNPDFPDEWDPSPEEEFRDLWNTLHGPGAWDANPEVVAISFDVHKLNIDAMPKAVAA